VVEIWNSGGFQILTFVRFWTMGFGFFEDLKFITYGGIFFCHVDEIWI
jgi:hypothetical protein